MDTMQARRHFKKVDSVMYETLKRHKKDLVFRKPLRTNQQLFTALAESVVSQQLAVKAADVIWARVEKICGGRVTPECILKTSVPRLRTAGLSGAKVKTLKELSKAVQGGLTLLSLKNKTPQEAQEILTKIWGIGPWTCEMFLMFALEHPDIFSSRDLGLMRSMETLYKLPRTVSREKLEKIAEKWSPYRTLACRVLWRARDKKQ
jgi:DNA-3-methyladenine glycosylase II